MAKITNEAIFNSVQMHTKKVDVLIKTVNGMFLELMNLKEWASAKDFSNKKISKDISFIKTIVENDATKQKNHEAEHTANVSAHDRFETRIKILEKAKKLSSLKS